MSKYFSILISNVYQPTEWDDGFTNSHLPDYKVYEDKYCQGYIGILKKNRKYKQYINVIMKPGGIRPLRKRDLNELPQADSMYSDGNGSRKGMSNIQKYLL